MSENTATGPASGTPTALDNAALTAAVTEQAKNLEGLAALVKNLMKNRNKEVPVDWNWRVIGPEGAKALWTELAEFVTWLVRRYELHPGAPAALPTCWYRHGAIVEELTALMVAWKAAYYGPSVPNADAINWHDRWLAPCLVRVQDFYKRCDGGDTHQDRPPVSLPGKEGIGDFLAQDQAARSAHVGGAVILRPVSA